jgi:7-carboxy-7-deazaguanine synthase
MSKILISECFDSIQGEGKYSGVPSFFIRTSSCNLRCWFCDSRYTSWEPEGQQVDTDKLVADAIASRADHVVITGGEPMLYPAQVADICDRLSRFHGKKVTIETNGTRYDERVVPDLWSVSPKLAGSAPLDTKSREYGLHTRGNAFADNLAKFQQQDAQFKFVVCAEADLVEVRAIVEQNHLPASAVWLMPQGKTRDEVLANAGWLAEACKQHGYNLTLRLHTLLWGMKRGV